MRHLMAFLAMATVTSSAGARAAGDPLPVVFGIQLGAPAALPECKRMVLTYPHPDGSPAPYETVQPATCQQMPEAAAPTSGAVVFTREQMPSILYGKLVVTAIIDGRVQGLYAATLGLRNSDTVISQLTSKFGQPSSASDEKVMIDGIAVSGKVIEWERPGYSVEYHTVRYSADYGQLMVETTEGHDHRLQVARDRDAQRTPL